MGGPVIEPFALAASGVVLRPWRDTDIDGLWAALQDPAIRLWNGSGSASLDDARRFIDRRRDWSSGDHASWAIVDHGTGALVGSMSLHRIDREHASAEIGYWTVPSARGRGVATDAVIAVCDWAFATLRLERVELRHAVENAASAHVADKAGFTCEGRLRRSYRYADGTLHDELCWSRLRDDPPPGRSARRVAGTAPTDGAPE